MHIPLKPHTELELLIAKSLFDEFQKSVNDHPDTLEAARPYCNKFDYLDRRLKQAWLDTAKFVISVKH